MAFSRAGLAKIASCAGDAPSIFSYTTADTVATVNTANYFLEAIREINLGDVLFVFSSTGGTPVMTINYCNSNTGTAIDVTDGLVVTATDTD